MSYFNAGLDSHLFNNVAPITVDTSTISVDSVITTEFSSKVGTLDTVSTISTANALSITSGVLRAHIGSGANYGFVQGLSNTTTSLGNNTLTNITSGTGNIAFGENINTLTTGNNNILFRGDCSAASAGSIVLGNATSTVDNEFVLGIDITRIIASGLTSVASQTYLTYIAGVVQRSSIEAVLLQGGASSALTGNIDMGGIVVSNVSDGTDLQAVSKSYIDRHSAGLDPKESCTYVTLSNITDFTTKATVEATLDPVGGTPVLADLDRVLVKNQIDDKLNGIYRWNTVGGLLRAPDQDGTPASEVSGGNFTFIENGDTLENTGWVLQGDGVLTLGVDSLVWIQFSGGEIILASNVGAGAGVFKDKVGTTLNYRSIIGSSGISATQNTDDVTFAATNVLSSLGGESLVVTSSAPNYSIKGLVAGTGITFTVAGTDISIASTSLISGSTSIFSRMLTSVEAPVSYPQYAITNMNFNTVERDDIGISLAGGIFTVPTGSYKISGTILYSTTVANIMMIMRDTADTVLMTSNTMENGGNANDTQRISILEGIITLATSTDIKLEFYSGVVASGTTTQEIKNPVSQMLVTGLNETLTSRAGLTDYSSGRYFPPKFSTDNSYVSIMYRGAGNVANVGVFTVSPFSLVTSINYSANTIADNSSEFKFKMEWGITSSTVIYLTAGDTIYAYNFNGATLTLLHSVVNVAFSNMSINETPGGNDLIVIGAVAKIFIYSFNGATFTLVANVTPNTIDNTVYGVNWSRDGTLVAVYGRIGAQRWLEMYSWNGAVLTFVTALQANNANNRQFLNILPNNDYIIAADSTTVFGFDGITLTIDATKNSSNTTTADKTRYAYYSSVINNMFPMSIDILATGGTISIEDGKRSAISNLAFNTTYPPGCSKTSNYMAWLGTGTNMVLCRMIYGDNDLKNKVGTIRFTKL